MNLKLRITNNNKESRIIPLLTILNFYKKDDILIELIDSDMSYEKLIKYLSIESAIIKFINTTNNRQLSFYNFDLTGSRWAIKPIFKVNKHGIRCVLPYSKWNPEKYNIADSKENVTWRAYSLMELNVSANQIFEIEFIILDGNFTPPTQITKP